MDRAAAQPPPPGLPAVELPDSARDLPDDLNHAHTVLRRPDSDFGGDVLADHRARWHAG